MYTVFIGAVPVCSMFPKADGIKEEYFKWNPSAVESLEISKAALLDAVMSRLGN